MLGRSLLRPVLALALCAAALAGIQVTAAPPALADSFLGCDGPTQVRKYGPTPSGNTYVSKAKVCLVRNDSDHRYWQGVVRWTCFKNGLAYAGCRWDGNLQTRDTNGSLVESDFVCASCGGSYLSDSGQLFNLFRLLPNNNIYATTESSRVRFLLGDGTSLLTDSAEKASLALDTGSYQ